MSKDDNIIIRVSEDLKAAFEQECDLNDTTKSEVLREYMREYVNSGNTDFYRTKMELYQKRKQHHLERVQEFEEEEEKYRQKLEAAEERQDESADELRQTILEGLRSGELKRVFPEHAKIQRLAELEGVAPTDVIEGLKQETDIEPHRFKPLDEAEVST